MYLTLSLVMLLAGASMVWLGAPRKGVSPAFMRNGAVEMLWPVVCLGLLVCGVAGLVTGTGWSPLVSGGRAGRPPDGRRP